MTVGPLFSSATIGKLKCEFSEYFLFSFKNGFIYDTLFESSIDNGLYVKVKISPKNGLDFIKKYESSLIYAQPDFICPVFHNDLLWPKQFQLNNTGQYIDGQKITAGLDVNVQSVWNTYTGTGIKVSVIDDGIEDHEDLPTIFNSYAPADGGTGEPQDVGKRGRHGMAVAGIISALHNDLGIRGVAPSAMLIGVNIFKRGTSISDYADAFMWSMNQGADVINCSWGFKYEAVDIISENPRQFNLIAGAQCDDVFPALTSTINHVATAGRNGRGCVLVFSAGNWAQTGPLGQNSIECVTYPANLASVISVGAITPQGQRSIYSNYGPKLDVVAPSNDLNFSGSKSFFGVRTIDREGTAGYASGNYTARFGGTSASAPVVSGAAALILNADPGLSASQVKDLLLGTTTDVLTAGFDIESGYGLIDIQAAIDAIGTTVTRSAPCDLLGGDADNDGICLNSDCNDNDASYPRIPGTPCDDGDPSTSNDEISIDGCSCAGVAIPCYPFADVDGDGRCSNNDCNDNDAALPAAPGTLCNDGDLSTLSDTITTDSCTCVGIPIPDDCATCCATNNCNCTFYVQDVSTCLDTARLTVIGGCFSPTTLSYRWSTGDTTESTVSVPGLYIVTITDLADSCVSVATGQILGADQPEVSIIYSNITCADASLNLTSRYGTPPYTYQWSGGQNWDNDCNLDLQCNYLVYAEGIYAVTVTDANGCTDSTSIDIDFIDSILTVTLTAVNDEECTVFDESSISASATGEAPFSYLWTNSATSQMIGFLAPGNYGVTVTDANGCIGTDTISVALNEGSCDAPCDFGIIGDVDDCDGDITITEITPSGGVTYIWNDLVTTQNRTGLAPGQYSVQATDSLGCNAMLVLEVEDCCPVEICCNYIDDDGDGLVDCYDLDCACSEATAAVSVENSSNVPTSGNAIGAVDGLTAIFSGSGFAVYKFTASVSGVARLFITDEVGTGPYSMQVSQSNDNISYSNNTFYTDADVKPWAFPIVSNMDYIRVHNLSGVGQGFELDAILVGVCGDDFPCMGIENTCPLPNTVACGTLIEDILGTDGSVCYVCEGVGTMCVLGEECIGGTCSVNNPCAPLNVGDACNDGNPCTENTTINSFCLCTGGNEIANDCQDPTTVDCGVALTSISGCFTCVGVGTKCVSGTCTSECCTNLTDAGEIAGEESSCSLFDPSEITDSVAPSGGLGGTIEYQWLEDGLVVSGATTSSYNPPVIFSTKWYIRQSRRDCQMAWISTDTIFKYVNTPPTTIITGDQFTCAYDSTQITASGGVSYVWSDGETTASAYLLPGSYTVTTTDVNGCTDVESVSISDLGEPTANITASGTSICDEQTVNLSSDFATSYNWSTGSTASNIDVGPGTYTLTVTDENGCTSTDSQVVSSLGSCCPLVLNQINGGFSIISCSPYQASIPLSWNATTPNYYVYYRKNGGALILSGGAQSATSKNVSVTSPGSFSSDYYDFYIVDNVTSGGGCSSNIVRVWVTCNSCTPITLSVNPSLVNGCSIPITTVTFSWTATTPTYHLWFGVGNPASNFQDFTTTTNNSIDRGYALPGDAQFYIIDGDGCQSNTVTIDGYCEQAENCNLVGDEDGDGFADCLDSDCVPNANAGPNVSICSGDQTTLTATGGASYTWNQGLGSGASKIVSPTVTTIYTVTVTANNGFACTATDQVTVTVTSCGCDPAVGTPCSDGNACTINDVIQLNCICAGTTITNDCPAANTVACGDALVSPSGCFTCAGTGTMCSSGETCSGGVCTVDPSCPALLDPGGVIIVNSTCPFGGSPSGGSISPPSGGCNAGSTLQYHAGGGWSSTLPIYDQDGPAQLIQTRCRCDLNGTTGTVSNKSTTPATCSGCPDLSAVAPPIVVVNSSCPGGSPTGGSWAMPVASCPSGSTLQRKRSTSGTWSSSTSPISYLLNSSQTWQTRCVCSSNPSFTSPISSTTSVPAVTPNATISPYAGQTTTCDDLVQLISSANNVTIDDYLWSTSATSQAINVLAGSYTVTITSTLGCEGIDNQVISEVCELGITSVVRGGQPDIWGAGNDNLYFFVRHTAGCISSGPGLLTEYRINNGNWMFSSNIGEGVLISPGSLGHYVNLISSPGDDIDVRWTLSHSDGCSVQYTYNDIIAQ